VVEQCTCRTSRQARLLRIDHRMLRPVGVENSVTLCDVQVVGYETAEPVSSHRPDDRTGTWESAAGGRVLVERLCGRWVLKWSTYVNDGRKLAP
jgi:uncharacterized protein (DUF2147 family)